jgi:hypothetical protein
MLFKLRDGNDIIYSKTFEEIDSNVYEPFKYTISKHKYLPVCIVRFVNKSVIYPEILECHPKTSLEDIEVKE